MQEIVMFLITFVWDVLFLFIVKKKFMKFKATAVKVLVFLTNLWDIIYAIDGLKSFTKFAEKKLAIESFIK